MYDQTLSMGASSTADSLICIFCHPVVLVNDKWIFSSSGSGLARDAENGIISRVLSFSWCYIRHWAEFYGGDSEMGHTYEEIRNVVIDILIGREKVNYSPDQYASLITDVAEVFQRREGSQNSTSYFHTNPQLSSDDAELTREIFWDLFRQGIITLGLNDSNREFPFFKVSSFGTKVLHNQNPYFFHRPRILYQTHPDQCPENQ